MHLVVSRELAHVPFPPQESEVLVGLPSPMISPKRRFHKGTPWHRSGTLAGQLSGAYSGTIADRFGSKEKRGVNGLCNKNSHKPRCSAPKRLVQHRFALRCKN